jgi:hypothetical protein
MNSLSTISGFLTFDSLKTSKTFISNPTIKKRSTFGQLVLFTSLSFKIQNVTVKLLDDELILIETLVSNVENRVLVRGLVVHVEYDVGLRNGNQVCNVLWLGSDSALADWNMHVTGVLLKYFNRA